METLITWWSVVIAAFVSLATGIAFGIYPARRADGPDRSPAADVAGRLTTGLTRLADQRSFIDADS